MIRVSHKLTALLALLILISTPTLSANRVWSGSGTDSLLAQESFGSHTTWVAHSLLSNNAPNLHPT